MRLMQLLGAMAVTLCSYGMGYAGFVYNIQLDQSSYSVVEGGQINVGLSLVETWDGSGAASTFSGLSAYNLAITRTDPSAALSFSSFSDSLGTGVVTPSQSGLQSRLSFIDLSAPYAAPTIAGAVRTIQLGSFSFNANQVGTGTLTVSTFSTNELTIRDSVGVGTGINFEANDPNRVGVLGSASFTVTAVPEPSSMALIGAGLALVGGVSRFRKKRLAVKSAV